MADLIATKRVTYAGRVYRPGVAFNASPAHARLLVAHGVAGFAPERTQHVTSSYALQTRDPSIDVLRAAYRAKAGKAPDSRWREKRLAKEIASL
jgi:hypothetical protein